MPVTIRWKVGSEEGFRTVGERFTDKMFKALAGGMARVLQTAISNAKQFSADRVDTGLMISSIQGDMDVSARSIIATFGFTGQQADYFAYQTTTGFTHYLSSVFIEPTFALRDAKLIAEGDTIAAIEAAIRSV